MRSFAAVTTFNANGYELYGRQMIETFDRHWPKEVPLFVYAEGFEPELPSERIVALDLVAECPGLVDFKERHRDDPSAHGARRERCVRLTLRLRPFGLQLKQVPWGRGFRWDAVRFSHKSFAIFGAARRQPADGLFWLDGDMRFLADLPLELLGELLPADCLVSCLERSKNAEIGLELLPTTRRARLVRRRGKHPECSFVGYNLRHPAIGEFLADFEAMYTEDRLFEEREFHDSYLFDRVRERYAERGHATHDIADGIGREASHVLLNSRLGRYMDHMKGERKVEGSSRESDRLPKP